MPSCAETIHIHRAGCLSRDLGEVIRISSQVAGDSETEHFGPEEGLEGDWSEQLTLTFKFAFMHSSILAF